MAPSMEHDAITKWRPIFQELELAVASIPTIIKDTTLPAKVQATPANNAPHFPKALSTPGNAANAHVDKIALQKSNTLYSEDVHPK